MLRDDMGIVKKELIEARGQVVEATSITGNIDGRFHLLESEMNGVWKRLQDEAVGPRSGKGSPAQGKAQVVKLCYSRSVSRYLSLDETCTFNGMLWFKLLRSCPLGIVQKPELTNGILSL